jgi:hypothetical protein
MLRKHSRAREGVKQMLETQMKERNRACVVREGAVGNVPKGNALAAYFTLFVCGPFTLNSAKRGRVGTLF